MRYGFTTGSCAAAAAKAAAYMLLTGKRKEEITIDTPKGIPFQAKVEEIKREEKKVSCAVQKDGGDDPDVTSGAYVYAEVSLEAEGREIRIDGGVGVGRVTKPGLDQPVGNAAINHVPREMIEKEVREICELADYKGGLFVEISIPKGVELAAQTFNPRLGIVGGISVLGTTGIVEPMSTKALLDTIKVELKVKQAAGYAAIAISPGNYGLDFMKKAYHYDLDSSVKCSNFIGDTLEMIAELGFKEVLLLGHIGKLVKVAGGILNTHSKEGDCRMELLAAAAIKSGMETAVLQEILKAVTTEEAIHIIDAEGKKEEVMSHIMEQIMFYLQKKVAGRFRIECIVYSNEFGELGKSSGAEELLKRLPAETRA
ncbi:MAG: cobalt-precorrin-5B (C(1))-methyltransferase CbiD [Roseburia sp.]